MELLLAVAAFIFAGCMLVVHFKQEAKKASAKPKPKPVASAKPSPPRGSGLEATKGVRPEPGTRTGTAPKTQPKTNTPAVTFTATPTPPSDYPERTPASEMWLPRSGPDKIPELKDADGMPTLRLMEKTVNGETALRLCHVGTGRWTVEGDTRLPRAGIWAVKARGTSYHQSQIRKAGLTMGGPVELVREPNNEHDPYAVAIVSNGQRVGYYNKGKAKRLATLMDAGTTFEAVCLDPINVWVLAAEPHVMAHLRSPWPQGAPKPVR